MKISIGVNLFVGMAMMVTGQIMSFTSLPVAPMLNIVTGTIDQAIPAFLCG